MIKVEKLLVCPRCKQPVRSDEHILQLQLVNADPGVSKQHTHLKDAFHHKCAAAVWNAAAKEWYNSE